MSELSIAVRMLPPTVNHMYAPNKDGGKRLTEEAKTFRELAGHSARNAAQHAGWCYQEGARLALTVRLTFDTKRFQDIDNRVKAALDALALALGFNDNCVDRIVIERAGYVPKRPRCELVLKVLE